MPEIPEVLFVCVHNAGRSQMAAALLQHHANGAVSVRSAGSTPADEVNPAVLEVMAEVGIDLAGEVPKKLTTDAVQASDVVITMGCGDACPVFPGKRYLDWDLTDPGPRLNMESVTSLREVGVDIGEEHPKPIDPDLLRSVDLVVTLGREATVVVPDGVELRNWDTDEPSERGIDGAERMRLIRDDIHRRVDPLRDELLAKAIGTPQNF